jgi:hypothetical protein
MSASILKEGPGPVEHLGKRGQTVPRLAAPSVGITLVLLSLGQTQWALQPLANMPTGQTKTLYVYARVPGTDLLKKVRLLLDAAANRSLCKRMIVNELQAAGVPTDLAMNLAGGNVSKTTREHTVWLNLVSLDGKYNLDVQVTTTRKIEMLPPIMYDPRSTIT